MKIFHKSIESHAVLVPDFLKRVAQSHIHKITVKNNSVKFSHFAICDFATPKNPYCSRIIIDQLVRYDL